MVRRLLLAAAAASSVALSDAALMEGGASVHPDTWVTTAKAPQQAMLELTFAVKQRGLRELEDALMRVSTPSSPDYGKHLTNQEVHDMTAPDPKHLQAVEDFLKSFGVDFQHASPNSDFIVASVPVEVAETMLSTEYVRLTHQTSGDEVLRAPSGYSLPDNVASAVDFVSPTVHVPGVQRLPPSVSQHNVRSDGLFNSPETLRKLYNVDVEGKAANNKQAVTAFLNQRYGLGSLHTFWKLFCGRIVCGKGDPKLVGDAAKAAVMPGIEAMLDIETITGVAGNVESEFWGFSGQSPDNKQNEPFMKWLTQLSSTADADVPKIFSTSYGESEGSWSYAAAQRLNAEFQKAGARGITLLFASGDSGANCTNGKFTPNGPADSPYVTSVGGTQPADAWPNPGGEEAIPLSSGGFSNYWPMPDYQKDAVAKYLQQSGLPPKAVGYNASGRAFPDISAQATLFYVEAGIPEPLVMGTSAASPTAAGVLSMLNDLRLQNGKPSLGFLNPLIYANMHAFNDIVNGTSESGSSDCPTGRKGWPAKTGWDAATGVGTPDYGKLAKVVAALPDVRSTELVV